MKSSKVVSLVGFLLGIAFLGGLACAFAGLLMLMWNVVGVAALSIAAPLMFLTALKGIGILYGLLALVNIIRVCVQKFQMQVTMGMMRQFEKEMKKQKVDATNDILHQYFHTN